jgi:predicted TIM-barrel fold metal-dependent hydrolase
VLGGQGGIGGQPMAGKRVDQRRHDDPVAGSAGVEDRVGEPTGFVPVTATGRLRLCRPSAAPPKRCRAPWRQGPQSLIGIVAAQRAELSNAIAEYERAARRTLRSDVLTEGQRSSTKPAARPPA